MRWDKMRWVIWNLLSLMLKRRPTTRDHTWFSQVSIHSRWKTWSHGRLFTSSLRRGSPIHIEHVSTPSALYNTIWQVCRPSERRDEKYAGLPSTAWTLQDRRTNRHHASSLLCAYFTAVDNRTNRKQIHQYIAHQNVPPFLACHNFDTHEPILTIFGRHVNAKSSRWFRHNNSHNWLTD